MGELVDQMLAYWRDLMVIQCAGEHASDLSVPSRCRPDLIRQGKASHARARCWPVWRCCPRRGFGCATAATAGRSWRWRWCGYVVSAIFYPWRSWRRCLLAAHPPEAQARRRGEIRRHLRFGLVLAARGRKKKPLNNAADAPSPTPTAVAASPTDVWPQILRSVGPMMGNFLEKAGLPAITGPNSLALRFPADYNQAREYCQEPARLAKIEEAVRKSTGHPWILRVEAGPLPRRCPLPWWRRRLRRGATIGLKRRKSRWSSGPWTLWGADRPR